MRPLRNSQASHEIIFGHLPVRVGARVAPRDSALIVAGEKMPGTQQRDAVARARGTLPSFDGKMTCTKKARRRIGALVDQASVTAYTSCVPLKPLSSTPRGSPNIAAPTLLSTNCRSNDDTRISPPTALPATREAMMTFLP